MSRTAPVADVSGLPTFSFGTSNPLWWGNLAFMVIEGLGFVFAIVTYLYLRAHNASWPLGPQPPLRWPTVLVLFVVLSEVANVWVKRAASRCDLAAVRRGLVVMAAVGVVALALRVVEWRALNVRFDENAYGSIVWFLLGLHTAHLVTDVSETLVIAVLVHRGPIDARRFPEVQDNQDYWHFVVVFAVVVYVVLYWLPRWLGAPA
jgi:heme/copper-type cytochrome/quinol oxidase subunit 3